MTGVFLHWALVLSKQNLNVYLSSVSEHKRGASGSTALNNTLRKKKFIEHLQILTSLTQFSARSTF